MCNIYNNLYNNILEFAKTVTIYTIDMYSYFEFWCKKAYMNISSTGSLNNMCNEINTVTMITNTNESVSYVNVLENMTETEFSKILQDTNNSISEYKFIFVENIFNNQQSRIICSKSLLESYDIETILDPKIFELLSVECPYMNINARSLTSENILENINLKSPINYMFKYNQLLCNEFLLFFVDNTFFNNTAYDIELLDNDCGFTIISQEQCIIIGNEDFYVVYK